MTTVSFNFKAANQYFPHIILVGLGIGTANYLLNDSLTWIQWIIQSLSTSFLIGYTLVLIGLNKAWLEKYLNSKAKLFLFLFFAFVMVGALATEMEHYLRSFLFQSHAFQPFSEGKMYLFNAIISLILGFSFFYSHFPKNKKTRSVDNQKNLENKENSSSQALDAKERISKIPVKQGENILLIPIEEIVYFEAFDNYSFVYLLTGGKMLCDYSLRFLETRLSNNFSRVHRKYIVNESHIQKITPHLNGRFVITFDSELAPITSSKGYASNIRKIIKIG